MKTQKTARKLVGGDWHAVAAAVSAAVVIVSARRGGLNVLPDVRLNLPGARHVGDAALASAFAAAADVLVVALFVLVVPLRRRRDHEPQPVAIPVGSPWSRLLAAAGACALLLVPVAVLLVVSQVAPGREPHLVQPAPPRHPQPTRTTSNGRSATTGTPDQDTQGVLIVVMAVAGTAVVAATVIQHRRGSTSNAGLSASQQHDPTPRLRERLASGTSAARQAIAAPGSARAAVIDAYVAMSAAIDDRTDRSEATRTPRRLLEHAVGAGLADPSAAGIVVDLFEKARFSQHSVSENDRRDAETALAGIRARLSPTRLHP